MTASIDQPLPETGPARRPPNADIEKTFMIATMVIVGFLSLWIVRDVIIRPFDDLATQQVCRWEGIEIDRTVVEHQRSNQVGLLNRSHASCTFAPEPVLVGDEVGPNETVRIGSEDGQIDGGPFYTLSKALGLGLQALLTYWAVQAAIRAIAYFRRGVDPGEWVVVAALALLAFFALSIARSALVKPLDSLVAQQECRAYSDEINQPLIDSERANTFTIGQGTEGFCEFGPGIEDQPAVTLTLEETSPSALYRVSKVAGIFLQLGAASLLLRFLVDPAFDFYRSTRRKTKSA